MKITPMHVKMVAVFKLFDQKTKEFDPRGSCRYLPIVGAEEETGIFCVVAPINGRTIKIYSPYTGNSTGFSVGDTYKVWSFIGVDFYNETEYNKLLDNTDLTEE